MSSELDPFLQHLTDSGKTYRVLTADEWTPENRMKIRAEGFTGVMVAEIDGEIRTSELYTPGTSIE